MKTVDGHGRFQNGKQHVQESHVMSWIVRTCYLVRMSTQRLASLSKNHVPKESQSRNEVK
jgi:hypothetical protein